MRLLASFTLLSALVMAGYGLFSAAPFVVLVAAGLVGVAWTLETAV